jgi:hypothetical protein
MDLDIDNPIIQATERNSGWSVGRLQQPNLSLEDLRNYGYLYSAFVEACELLGYKQKNMV